MLSGYIRILQECQICPEGHILASPEPPGEIMSFGVSPVNYSDSDSDSDHEARVMPNCDPRDRFVYPYLTRMLDSFSCTP